LSQLEESVTVNFDRAARRDLARLSAAEREAVLDGTGFVQRGIGDVLKLQARNPPEWRLRIGRYRVLFRRDIDVMTVFAVRDRKDAYR
jgi:mRNA interferase RelE/StbE